MSNNNSFVSIKIREEEKEYLEDLRRRRGKKLYEVVEEVVEAHRFLESLKSYLNCKTTDDLLELLSNQIPILRKKLLTRKMTKLQEEIRELAGEGLLSEKEAEEIEITIGKALDRLWKNAVQVA